jgi:tRNA-dihydrouridine synthase B
MIGRGAQGQPWLVGEIAAGLEGRSPTARPTGAELAAIVSEHYEGVLDEYGIAVGVRAARKHLDWYLEAAGLAIEPGLRKRLLQSETPTEVLGLIELVFGGAELRAAA